jgi:hypothetical protein
MNCFIPQFAAFIEKTTDDVDIAGARELERKGLLDIFKKRETKNCWKPLVKISLSRK